MVLLLYDNLLLMNGWCGFGFHIGFIVHFWFCRFIAGVFMGFDR
jgi:hypothetical protein